MRYLLAELLEGSPLYEVRRDGDGFMFVGHPDRLKEFSQIVRRAQDKAGDEYLVFPTSAPRRLYSQMFIVPIGDASLPDETRTF